MSSMLLLFAIATPQFAYAETPPTAVLGEQVANVVDAVQTKYADVDVLQASFVQVSQSDLYGREEQRGSVVLQRPSKMRWRFSESGKQFVTDGDTLWVYNPDDKQVLRFRDFAASASTVDSLLQSLHKVGELFEIEILDPGGADGYRLALVPRDEAAQAQVKRVELRLDASMVLKGVTITDAFDSVTELSFADVKLGGTVADDTFRFQIPDGVEVIDANAG